MDFAAVRDKIVEVLQTLEGSSKPLKKVFSTMAVKADQWPCSKIEFGGFSNERYDSASNEITVTFKIKIELRLQNIDNEIDDLTTQRMDITTAIVQAFCTNENIDTLGGLVHRFDLTPGESKYENEEIPKMSFYLLAKASKLQMIS